jgi:tripartite ATP-independent transporter DctM subunit
MSATTVSAPAAGPDRAPAVPAGSEIGRFESWLRLATEIPAAVIIVAEITILFVGIVSRTVFHHAIIWSDELASILFLWLAMFGTAIAVQRNGHMRLTVFVQRLGPRASALAEALAGVSMVLFLVMILHPAWLYVEDQSFVETPALGWSGVVRALAIPTGCVLALASTLARLVHARLVDIVVAIAFALVIGIGLRLGAPFYAGLGHGTLLVFFIGLLGFGLFTGVPIAFCFLVATVAYLGNTTSTPLTVVVGRMDEGMSSLILLAVPLFVVLGQLLEHTGMARVMVAFLLSLVGHVKAGMSYVMLGAMFLVSGISGSKTADMAAVAPVLFPEMRKLGMKDGELVSLLAAAGAMSETIPPSLVVIAIASVTGVSIAALFTAGILPAIVLALVLALVARWQAGRDNSVELRPRAPFSQVRKTFIVAFPAIVLPFVIRSAVVEGIATATEVSTIGIAYALLVSLVIYRGELKWKAVMPMLTQSASLSGAILFIVGAASAMGWALTQSGFSHDLAGLMGAIPGGTTGFMLATIFGFIVLGSVLEGIPAIVLFGPLMFPIAHNMGIHEVHYAVVVVLAMGLGTFMPPLGLCYYAACAVGGASPEAALKRIWFYLAVLVVGMIAIAFVPWISLGFL